MSSIAERRVVVTGKVAGESRQTAEAKLREAGAIVQKAVNSETDVLVTGAAVGAKKLNAARAQGIDIIPWEQAFSGETNGITLPAARAPMPSVRQWAPMLALKSEEVPTSGGSWLFELKWDGVRGLITVKNGNVKIQSRSGLSDFTERYPFIVGELSELPDCVLDGELLAMGDELGLLGEDCDPSPADRYIVFDILESHGIILTSEPLEARRALLESLVPGGCYVAISPAFTDGEELLAFAKDKGLEGIVAKKLTSRYVEDDRSGKWVKVKVRPQQEFVVIGYTAGEGRNAPTFGALILGYYDESGDMRYAGKVGTGWDDADLRMIKEKMAPFEVEECMWNIPKKLKDPTWLFPSVVVEIAFQKWTDDLVLWHPSFVRVREDKDASDVVRET